MFRTLTESLAALAMRSTSRGRGLRDARLGVERLETRNLLSAASAGWFEQTSWHFEDGRVERYDMFGTWEATPSGYRWQYETVRYSSSDAPGRYESAMVPTRREGFNPPPLQSQFGGLPATHFKGIEGEPTNYPSGAYGPPGDKQPLRSLASPTDISGGARAGVDSSVKGASGVFFGPQRTVLTDESGNQQGQQADGSGKGYMQLDNMSSALAATLNTVSETAVDKSRLLSTLESHDAVFQALAAQSSTLHLRNENEWLTSGAGSIDNDGRDVLSTRSVVDSGQSDTDSGDALQMLRDKAATPTSRGGETLEGLVDKVDASHRAERRATVTEQYATEAAAPGGAAVQAAGTAPSGEVVVAAWDGGMVLLRTPEGRGDLDAVDAAMALEGGVTAGTTIGMDAGVGMYRAFDVGTANAAKGAGGSSSRGASSVSTEPQREAIANPSSATGTQLAAVVAGTAVLGAWSAKSRARADERRRHPR